MRPPRPVLAVVCAVIGHVAFLYTLDATTLPWKLGGYAAAVFGCLAVRWCLAVPAELQGIATRGAARVCEVLLLVGAGYCTLVEPGVIKLFDCIPMGWVAAALVMLLEYLRALGLPAKDRFALRLVCLAIVTTLQATKNIAWPEVGHDANRHFEYLCLLSLWVVGDIVISARKMQVGRK